MHRVQPSTRAHTVNGRLFSIAKHSQRFAAGEVAGERNGIMMFQERLGRAFDPTQCGFGLNGSHSWRFLVRYRLPRLGADPVPAEVAGLRIRRRDQYLAGVGQIPGQSLEVLRGQLADAVE